MQYFKATTFVLPAVNAGQKLVDAYMLATKKPVKARQNAEREITLSGFEKPDNQIAIIAIRLDKGVMENGR